MYKNIILSGFVYQNYTRFQILLFCLYVICVWYIVFFLLERCKITGKKEKKKPTLPLCVPRPRQIIHHYRVVYTTIHEMGNLIALRHKDMANHPCHAKSIHHVYAHIGKVPFYVPTTWTFSLWTSCSMSRSSLIPVWHF